MDIDEKLHKRIKDCSIRDDRTLNSTIKKVLSAGIGIVETRVQSYDDNHTIGESLHNFTDKRYNTINEVVIDGVPLGNKKVEEMTEEEREEALKEHF